MGIFFDSAGQYHLSLSAPIFGKKTKISCFFLTLQDIEQINSYSKKHLAFLSVIVMYSLFLWLWQPEQHLYVMMILLAILASASSVAKYLLILIKPKSLTWTALISRETQTSRKIYILMGSYSAAFVFFIWQIMIYCGDTQWKSFFIIATIACIICTIMALFFFSKAILWR
jgi:predicted neutral ceramidase superfamily lipid hydrolase